METTPNTTNTPSAKPGLSKEARSSLIGLLVAFILLCVAPVTGGLIASNLMGQASSAACDTLQGVGQQIGGNKVENPQTAESCKAGMGANRVIAFIVGAGFVFVPVLMVGSIVLFVIMPAVRRSKNPTADSSDEPPATASN